MSDKPVWMEEWSSADESTFGDISLESQVKEKGHLGMDEGLIIVGPARARLAASAPALVRALLLAEWADNDDEDCCPVCGELKPEHDQESTGGWTKNGRPCALDAALTIAGFTDQASRDAAREMIRNGKA